MNWPFGNRIDPVKAGQEAARNNGHVDTSRMNHKQAQVAENARAHELERMRNAATNK